MIHARDDYAPIQDPRPDGIPAGEPVFLLRAQDITAPSLVRRWAEMARRAGAADDIVNAAYAHADRMLAWQDAHGRQVPDLPGDG